MASQCWCQKSIFRIQQFQLVVNLIYNVKSHDFPRHLSSNKYPKYLTLEFCLVCISTYFKVSLSIFFLLNLVAKCIDLVVSSSKFILSLLLSNQSHILQKSSFNWLSLCWQTRHISLVWRKRSHSTAYDMSLTYIKNNSGPRIEPWGTLRDTDPGWEKLSPKLSRNNL